MEFSRQECWSGYHSLLQGILLSQGSNPGLLHCRKILYHLSHRGSPTVNFGNIICPSIHPCIHLSSCSSTHWHVHFTYLLMCSVLGLLCWLSGKESACTAGDVGLIPGFRRSPEKEMATNSSILTGKSHGQRSLGGLWFKRYQRISQDFATKQQQNSVLTLCQTDAALWSFKIELCGSLVLRSMNKVLWVPRKKDN